MNSIHMIKIAEVAGAICVWLIAILLSMLPLFMTWVVKNNTEKDQMLNIKDEKD